MLWKNVGYLCTETETLDALKRPLKTYTKRKVYCDIKSIRQSEFYQSRTDGYKPEIMVIVRSFEYNQENHFEYKTKLYRIARTYEKGDNLEIICTSTVQNNG